MESNEFYRKYGQILCPEVQLVTAEILYHMPDHPSLLQTYIWQEYDLLPKFPKLKEFLDFWSHSLEGKLHSVCLAHTGKKDRDIIPLKFYGMIQ